MTESERLIRAALQQRILILDGAMGTTIQARGLEERDFRGERFADHSRELKGNNELLSLTRPDVIEEIHDSLLRGGRRHRRNQHPRCHGHRPERLRAGGIGPRAESGIGPHRARSRPALEQQNTRQAALRGGRPGAHAEDALDRTGRERPGLPRDPLRRAPRLPMRSRPAPSSKAAWTSCWSRRSSTP